MDAGGGRERESDQWMQPPSRKSHWGENTASGDVRPCADRPASRSVRGRPAAAGRASGEPARPGRYGPLPG
jgi:hypothetical protein